jgi:hypothetical protein
MRGLLTYLTCLCLIFQLSAQDEVQQIRVVRPQTGGTFLEWHGQPGRIYFLQVSNQSSPLQKWNFAPIIEVGTGVAISYEVETTADAAFFRLKFTDIPIIPGILPEEADPDDDGLSSEEELLETGTDPLDPDTDKDGLPDGWETENGLDPNNDGIDDISQGPDGDNDQDGLLNREEWEAGSDPNDADSDDDGVTDGGEVDQDSNPNDPQETPEAEWFVLTGTYTQNLVKARSRAINIPPGQSRLVVVLVASDEYPEFTGEASQFNDQLTWNVEGGGLDLNGNIDVNSRHSEWDWALLNDISLLGFNPVHLEDYHSVQAPDNASLQITVALTAKNIADDILPSTVIVGFLPIEFEITHTEKERDENGTELTNSVNPGANTLLRDEIADLKIKLPSLNRDDWDLTIDLEPTEMKSDTLGARGSVQMYDFGKIEESGVVPFSINTTGATIAGPYPLTIPGANGGDETLRFVVNKNGTVRIRLKSADNKIDVKSQEFSVTKRIRKYARRPENNNADFDKHDNAFQDAAEFWGSFYQHPIDPDITKAMGMQESTLGFGLTPTDDILTINAGGNDLDHIQAILRREHTTNEKEAILDENEDWQIRWLDYDEADATSARTAIHWGTCWLYHKGQKGKFTSAPDNPPHYVTFSGWNTWETAVSYFGPNIVYLGVIEGPWKRGRRDSTTGIVNGVWTKIDFDENNYQYLWPILSNHRVRK